MVKCKYCRKLSVDEQPPHQTYCGQVKWLDVDPERECKNFGEGGTWKCLQSN